MNSRTCDMDIEQELSRKRKRILETVRESNGN